VTHAFPPGSIIGVLGGGQLGRMFAMAARRLGYRIHVLAPESDTPAGQVADVAHQSRYDDIDAVRAFAAGVHVVTFEFENVPASTAAAAAERSIVRPSGRALAIAQHRGREKAFLAELGLPVVPFRTVRGVEDLNVALREIGRPAVLKTAALGYDGKGQARIDDGTDPSRAWTELGGHEAVAESLIDLEREFSIVGARGVDGISELFTPMDNVHRHHILDLSTAPASLPPAIVRQAIEATRAVLNALDYVGVLCVEFFLARDGRLFINELAPRPHNSAHLTIDACRTSQFEQHARAICGLPLGSPDLLQPAAMANLLGDLWTDGEPDWSAALADPDVKLHLYGKLVAKPGRKMGHITVVAPTPGEAATRAVQARDRLKRN
jgi:5-(carboxyamino)imidazole ribonucleotide synthase